MSVEAFALRAKECYRRRQIVGEQPIESGAAAWTLTYVDPLMLMGTDPSVAHVLARANAMLRAQLLDLWSYTSPC